MSKFTIFQHGYSVFGEGETLADAVGKTNEFVNFEDRIDADEIENIEHVGSPVDGEMYYAVDVVECDRKDLVDD